MRNTSAASTLSGCCWNCKIHASILTLIVCVLDFSYLMWPAGQKSCPPLARVKYRNWDFKQKKIILKKKSFFSILDNFLLGWFSNWKPFNVSSTNLGVQMMGERENIFWHNWTLAVPNLFVPNFGKFLKKHLAANFKKSIKVRGYGKDAPAGLGGRRC